MRNGSLSACVRTTTIYLLFITSFTFLTISGGDFGFTEVTSTLITSFSKGYTGKKLFVPDRVYVLISILFSNTGDTFPSENGLCLTKIVSVDFSVSFFG